jgi:nucleoside-diphosphate-sugar epimerase
MAAQTFDLPIISLRLFPTYGPFQESAMFIPSAITSLLSKKTFTMSPGEQKREFNFVDDIVEAYLKAAVCSEAHGKVFNVGNGIPYTLKQVIGIIKELIGGNLNIELGARPYRKGEGSECFCDNHTVSRLTGWSPQVSLKEGLRMTIEWYKTNFNL